MGGEEPQKEDDKDAFSPALAGVKLVDAPILFFVSSHKAFKRELQELRRIVLEASDSFQKSPIGEFVDNFCRRLGFFKVVFKYHSAAEDELIFMALDTRVKNVAVTYALEHKCIDDDFTSAFGCLDLLRQDSEEISNLFQKLIFSIGTIGRVICQHMLKEEEQVFHLLIEKFTSEEQAKLLWQYMCSIPVVLLEEFLQWIAGSLPPDEQIDLLQCMKVVIPKEELFQEVVISWLDNKKISEFRSSSMYSKEAIFCGGEICFQEILDMYPGKFHFGEDEESSKVTHRVNRHNPFDSIHVWNTVLRRGFRKALDEIYQIRSSNNVSRLSSLVGLLQFLMGVLISYSNVLDRIYYPTMNELGKKAVALSSQQLVDESQLSRLVKLLQDNLEDESQVRDFLEGLYREVVLLIRGISKNLIFLETEVFPLISKSCSHEMQLWLLYTGLQTVPLGLLKCTVLWFSATLSEDQFKTILDSIKVVSHMRRKYFSTLLREWIRMGYLGKTSTDEFRKHLQEGCSIGSHFLPEQCRKNLQESFSIGRHFLSEQENIKFSNWESGMQAIEGPIAMELEPNSTLNIKKGIWNPSSSFSIINEEVGGSWSGKINMQMFFPGMWRNTVPVPKYPVDYGTGNSSSTLELGLVDHIFFYHKALVKDLEDIVLLSAKLSKDVQSVRDFQRHFQRLQLLYDIHSETEDGILFPRLESKGKLKNVTQSYTIDHKLETEHFKKIPLILNEISILHGDPETFDLRRTSYHHLCLELHETCLSLQRIISEHFTCEEIVLGPLVGEHFSIEEQHKIIGDMLGRTRAETLQEMIPWLMSCLSQDEQRAIMSLWRKVTKSTNFDEWLIEWWEGVKVCDRAKYSEHSSSPASLATDPLEIVSKYLGKHTSGEEGNWQNKGSELSQSQYTDYDFKQSKSISINNTRNYKLVQNCPEHQTPAKLSRERKEGNGNENVNCIDQTDEVGKKFGLCPAEHPLALNQKELENAIRRISRDSTLDLEKKSHLIQSLLMSRWMATQQRSKVVSAETIGQEEDLGQYPSYKDSLKLTFGCKHYKRNCKLLTTCCNKLYPCIRCHDESIDHSVDRKVITKMMCMKCLTIQPIGPKCSNPSCNNFSMARYYCKICKLFDDERQIYHCPYCNLCRVGKGLGIDYFHCMNCNACMSRSLSVHICREKCFEDNCPICHEYIFTSNSPVKALPCGHLMHSECFEEYTCSNYTCPICSKSLGDMQVYFAMLDALLAEEKIPEEYLGQTQVILCNDCERRGSAPFHWLYHKCLYCGSYNTRLL